MTYETILAQRGYRRITIERTSKSPGDLVLEGRGVTRIPVVEVAEKVTPIRKGRRG